MPGDWRWRHLTAQAAAGAVPSQRPAYWLATVNAASLFTFSTERRPTTADGVERAFSLGAASHTRTTRLLTGYCTGWRKPAHRTLNFNFITGNEGHAAPYTCTEVSSGKIIMPCNAARMKDLAMNKTNKPDLLLLQRLMLLFNNVTLMVVCIFGIRFGHLVQVKGRHIAC